MFIFPLLVVPHEMPPPTDSY